jgi:hypothetical protein
MTRRATLGRYDLRGGRPPPAGFGQGPPSRNVTVATVAVPIRTTRANACLCGSIPVRTCWKKSDPRG